MVKFFEFIERASIYYTVEAENEEEAWQKLDGIQFRLPDDFTEVSMDIHECFINDIEEIKGNENA